jgi:hypothetical protein
MAGTGGEPTIGILVVEMLVEAVLIPHRTGGNKVELPERGLSS